MISASGLFLLNLIEGHLLLKFHKFQPGICTVQTDKTEPIRCLLYGFLVGDRKQVQLYIHAIWQSFDMRQKIEFSLAHKTIPGKW